MLEALFLLGFENKQLLDEFSNETQLHPLGKNSADFRRVIIMYEVR